jgi:hypothetical protein
MIAIPYSTTVISTELDSESIRERLLTVVGPNKDFRGKLTANGFRLRRNLRWEGSSYRPAIDGKFSSSSKRTDVRLSFWASPRALIQLAAFFGFAEYLSVLEHDSMWWPITASITLHVGLCFFSFVPGQRWAESRLREVLGS